MTVRLSCPYCETAVSLVDLPATHRVVCPRCGETFAAHATEMQESGPHIPVASRNGSHPPDEPTDSDEPAAPERSLIGLLLFGFVLGAFVVGLGMYAIFRGDANRGEQDTSELTPAKLATTMPPLAVRGLGYLPKDTNVAFAVQPGALLTYAERTKADPKELLIRAGVPAAVFTTLDQLGVELDQIQSLVGGLTLANDSLIPRAVVVLTLRKKLADPAAFLKQLKAQPIKGVAGSTRYKVTVANLPMELAILDAGPYLFATDAKDLDAISSPLTAPDQLTTGLRESLTKLSPASFAWVATDSEEWGKKPAITLAAQALKQPDLPARLATLRAAAIGVSLEPELQLRASVRTPDTASATKLQDQLANALAAKSPTIGLEGTWVSVALPFDAKDGINDLKDLLPRPAKK